MVNLRSQDIRICQIETYVYSNYNNTNISFFLSFTFTDNDKYAYEFIIDFLNKGRELVNNNPPDCIWKSIDDVD